MLKPITYDYNLEVNAQIEIFHNWAMPISYTSIIDEYLFTREFASLFDVSHMGRILVSGSEASKYLDYIITNNVSKLKIAKAIYSMLLNEDSGIIDDLIIYKLEEEKYFVVCNAANKDKVQKKFTAESINFDVKLQDLSKSVGQIAIQGPNSKSIVEEYLEIHETIPYFNIREINFQGENILATATGYTGENGYELYGKAEILMQIWRDLLKTNLAKAAGLGARDVLRLEAGYCLHGNDIDESTSPVEAGLEWTVDFKKEDFIGKNEASRKNKILKGLIFSEGEKLIPRKESQVLNEASEVIGKITSGAFSKILNRAIALCYIENLNFENETNVFINIRNKNFQAKLTQPWFYRNIKGKEINYEKIL